MTDKEDQIADALCDACTLLGLLGLLESLDMMEAGDSATPERAAG